MAVYLIYTYFRQFGLQHCKTVSHRLPIDAVSSHSTNGFCLPEGLEWKEGTQVLEESADQEDF